MDGEKDRFGKFIRPIAVVLIDVSTAVETA